MEKIFGFQRYLHLCDIIQYCWVDRGAPGCLDILAVYITKMSSHPGAPFLSSYGGLSGGLWPHLWASSPFSGPMGSPDVWKKSLDSIDTFISAILSNMVEKRAFCMQKNSVLASCLVCLSHVFSQTWAAYSLIWKHLTEIWVLAHKDIA